jgi:glycosyltransferase involved in cell wall biosynthesis
MDKAVLEAMACGVPPVVCNTTFTPLFGPWADRLIFEERNAEDLAERLYALVALEPDQRRDIGRYLRGVVVQEHDLEQLMDCFVTIFESL